MLSTFRTKLAIPELEIEHMAGIWVDPPAIDTTHTAEEYCSHQGLDEITVHGPAYEMLQGPFHRLENLENRVLVLEQQQQAAQKRQRSIWIANLLTDFIDKLYKVRGNRLPSGAGNDSNRSATKYTNAAERIGSKNWEQDFGIPIKYFNVLKKYSQFVNERNHTAHDTEVEFAEYMLSNEGKERLDSDYHNWGGLYKFVYGKSVEEIAASASSIDELLSA